MDEVYNMASLQHKLDTCETAVSCTSLPFHARYRPNQATSKIIHLKVEQENPSFSILSQCLKSQKVLCYKLSYQLNNTQILSKYDDLYSRVQTESKHSSIVLLIKYYLNCLYTFFKIWPIVLIIYSVKTLNIHSGLTSSTLSQGKPLEEE